MGTSSCGGRVEAREGKGKAQLRRPAASRPRRDYSGPPPLSAQKLKSRWTGCLRCPIIGASREKHPPPSPREGKAGFSALTRLRAITPKRESTGLPPADSLAPLPERAARNRAKAACFGRDTARGRELPRPLSRFMSACYRASARFHASTRYSPSSRCHASARYRASSRFRAQALRRTSAPRQRRLQATRPWCPSGRPRTPCPSTKHQSYPA